MAAASDVFHLHFILEIDATIPSGEINEQQQ